MVARRQPTSLKVRVFLDDDGRPMDFLLRDGAELTDQDRKLLKYFKTVDATLTLAPSPSSPIDRATVPAGEVVVPAPFQRAPTLRAAYRAGALSEPGDVCPHFGNAEVEAWSAGRVSTGKRPVIAAAGPRDARGVPMDVPLYAHAAYLEGRSARAAGATSDRNPYAMVKGYTGGRYAAWSRGWQEAS